MEMDEWWKQHHFIEMAGYEQSDVEDITGRIPLLLDKCVVNGKIDLTVATLRRIYQKAAAFVQQTRANKKKDQFRWNWYVRPIRRLGYY
jgi:hypothetical protein